MQKSDRQIKEKKMKKKSSKCYSKSCQYQITACITTSLLSLQTFNPRSSPPSIIQMVQSAEMLEED